MKAQTSRKARLTHLLRGTLFAVLLLAALLAAPYLGVRAFIELARAVDGRSASPREALSRLAIYPENGYSALLPANGDSKILQRHVLSHPAGILYVLGWEDEAGKSCVAVAFVEKTRDAFEGWKGRRAGGHCSRFATSVRVRRAGEFGGYSLVYGLSGQAALVKIAWLGGDSARVMPINGAYLAVLGRFGANASRVDFLDANGALIEKRRSD